VNSVGDWVVRRNADMVLGFLLNAFLFFIVGILNVDLRNVWLGIIWLVGSALWVSNFLWSTKTPYIRMTPDQMIVAAAVALPRKTIPWNGIDHTQRVGERRIDLFLKDGTRTKVYLRLVPLDDRDALVEEIERRVQLSGPRQTSPSN
jgi:hypothetical protein